jgi:hypothetical protein
MRADRTLVLAPAVVREGEELFDGGTIHEQTES